MMFLLLTEPVSQFIPKVQIEEEEQKFYVPEQLMNCYNRNNLLAVNIDIGEICVQFDVNFNENCNQLPPGIYLDIIVSNHADQVIRGQIMDFDYANDSFLCIQCPVLGDDTNCNFFQDVEAAQVVIKSLVRYTQLAVGKIQIQHSTQSNCYDQTRSQMYINANGAKLQLYKTFKCSFVAKYDSYDLKMTQIDGTIDQIGINEINEDGEQQVHVNQFDDYIEIEFNLDFSKYYLNFYNHVNFELTSIEDDITTTRTTQLSLVQSLSLSVMYLNPLFIVWASRFQLLADPLENAQIFEEQYGIKATRIKLRYEVFNSETGETISNLFFDTPSFTFLNIDRGIICNDNNDGGACSSLLSLLQTYDLSKIEILIHYHFYDKDNQVILYASTLVVNTQNTCWTNAEGVYYQQKVCGHFVKNQAATSCPFLQNTLINFTIDFGESQMTQQLNYSVDDQEVCVQCQDNECIESISNFFKQKQSLTFTFQSGDQDFSLVSVNNFNENYSELHSRIFIAACVIIVGLAVIFIYCFLKYKGVILGRKRSSKSNPLDNEDLE